MSTTCLLLGGGKMQVRNEGTGFTKGENGNLGVSSMSAVRQSFGY